MHLQWNKVLYCIVVDPDLELIKVRKEVLAMLAFLSAVICFIPKIMEREGLRVVLAT